ncbi:MAG TPA: sugar transferase [Candidatus Acidoferrum sp.]|nr:sugar transferase [Candidatus Acidoferrum sp.]
MSTASIDRRWLDRSWAMLTPMGRLLLNLHVLRQRWLWHWRNSGGDALKRALDIVGSALFLIALSPLYAVIAILIRLEDGGPAIFAQTRVGRYGREFRMYKFRSMRPDAEALLSQLLARNHHKEGVTFKIKDDPRLTRLGKWLRRVSFDELPQVWNVLKGDMSLVGPRPPVPREVARYSLADRRRLAVKPGLTCFWQIGGRSELDFSEQVKLDVRYIEARNLWTDLAILLKTLPAVAEGRGAC